MGELEHSNSGSGDTGATAELAAPSHVSQRSSSSLQRENIALQQQIKQLHRRVRNLERHGPRLIEGTSSSSRVMPDYVKVTLMFPAASAGCRKVWFHKEKSIRDNIRDISSLCGQWSVSY